MVRSEVAPTSQRRHRISCVFHNATTCTTIQKAAKTSQNHDCYKFQMGIINIIVGGYLKTRKYGDDVDGP